MCPKNSSFVKYCNKRLSNSLITGIPKIANTKNFRRKVFKLMIFFMSIAGFLWQTYTFLEMYLDYPVIQHVTIENPEVFSAPAVTLCNRNRLKRSLFCQFVPHKCRYFGPRARDFICNGDKKFCPLMKPENGKIGFPMAMLTRGQPKYNQSNEFLQAVGPQSQWDLLEECTIEKSAQSMTCKNMQNGNHWVDQKVVSCWENQFLPETSASDSNMVQVPYDRLPYTCFTFFSLIDEPNKEPENFTLSDYYSFRLNLHPEEDFFTAEKDGVFVSVHDPRKMKNPFAELMVLQSGYGYRLYVTMQHRQYLPPPYDSNCVDYMALWKKNGGRGPLSKTDCMQFCMMDALLDQRGCLTEFIVYPNNSTFCSHKSYNSVSEEMVKKCDSSCHEGCEVIEYSVKSEITENLKDKKCNESDYHCRMSYLDIEIKFNRLTVERLKSEPMFASEELFSHIGGYMGLWLGISLVTLFDLIEILVDITAYPMIKWKKMKTKIASYADDSKNV